MEAPPTGLHSSHGSTTYLQQTGRLSTCHSELNVAAPTFIHSTYSAAPASMVSKEADGHRLVQPRPPPLIPIQSSGLPVYSTSALPTGSSPSVPGGLPAPLHLSFSFSAGGHTQPIIDITPTEGRNLVFSSDQVGHQCTVLVVFQQEVIQVCQEGCQHQYTIYRLTSPQVGILSQV